MFTCQKLHLHVREKINYLLMCAMVKTTFHWLNAEMKMELRV